MTDDAGWTGGDRLPVGFYDRPVLEVARDLLNCVVTHAGVSVRLTEVEAYDGGQDPASHAYRGRSPRTAVMFGPPGGVYVYFTYGMHHCCNLVVGSEGRAAAVLLRAGEVTSGEPLARERRSARATSSQQGTRWVRPRDLARGPARLATCLALRREENGLRTTEPDAVMTVRRGTDVPTIAVRTGPRVGVAGPGGDGGEFPWRFWIEGEPTVSLYRPAVTRVRGRSGG